MAHVLKRKQTELGKPGTEHDYKARNDNRRLCATTGGAGRVRYGSHGEKEGKTTVRKSKAGEAEKGPKLVKKPECAASELFESLKEEKGGGKKEKKRVKKRLPP